MTRVKWLTFQRLRLSRAWQETLGFFRRELKVDALLAIAAFGIAALISISRHGKLDVSTLGYGLGAVVVILLITLVANLVRAPWLIYNEAVSEASVFRRRVLELEEAARPKLTVTCDSASGLRLGMGNERACLLFLKVTNEGGGQVRRAYAKVDVFEHSPARGDAKPTRRRLYRQQNVFLRWDGVEDDRFTDFHVSATLLVASSDSGSGYGLVNVGDSLFPGLRVGDTYELNLAIAADELAVLHKKLLVKMEPLTTTNEKGERVWWADAPLQPDFREWQDSDEVPDEFDLDEWEREAAARRESEAADKRERQAAARRLIQKITGEHEPESSEDEVKDESEAEDEAEETP